MRKRSCTVMFCIAVLTLEVCCCALPPEQECRELNEKAMSFARKGLFDEAVPLLEQALRSIETLHGKESLETASQLNLLATLYDGRGRYSEAETAYKRMLEILVRNLGNDHPAVASVMCGMGDSFRKRSDFPNAEPLYKTAVTIQEKSCGKDHPDLATSLNGLGLLYQSEGKSDLAEPLFRRALGIREHAFGKEHPKVAESVNNLAVAYVSLGRYAEAEPLCLRALATDEKLLGKDHPAVAADLNELAELYRARGKFAQAEPLCRRAGEICEKTLGRDHPETAVSLGILARLYIELGTYTDAESLQKRVLEINRSAFGPDHPRTVAALGNLGSIYDAQGKYFEAADEFRKALSIFEKILGPAHPQVATVMGNLGSVYKSMGKYREAERLARQALAIREKAFGRESPDVAGTLNNLALLNALQGKYSEAEPLYKRALEISEKVLGQEKVAICLNNLAGLYRDQGKNIDAESLYKRALEIREQLFGKEHPAVAASLNNLAEIDQAGGEQLYRRALDIFEKALGAEHPNVATILGNLANVYRSQKKYPEAETFQKRALTIREKALGKDNPDVAASLSNLARLFSEQGKFMQAEPLFTRALNIREHIFGRDHPDVALTLNYLASMQKEQKKYPAALELFARGIQTLERSSQIAGGEDFSEKFRRDQTLNTSLFLSTIASFQKEKPDEAGRSVPQGFRATEYSRSRAFLDQMAKASAEKMSGISLDDLQMLRSLDFRLRTLQESKARELTKPLKDRTSELASKQELLMGELRSERKALEAEFARKYPKFVELRKPAIITIEELQKDVLQPGEVMLSYWVGEEELFGFLIDRKNFTFLAQPVSGKQVREKVAAFQLAISQQVPEDIFKTAGLDLYQAVLAPFLASQAIDASQTLIIVPHDVLSAVPFESLPMSDAGTTFQEMDYLFRHANVAYIPSATILKAIRADRKGPDMLKKPTRPGLLLGDPVYSEEQLQAPASGTPASGSLRAALNPGARDVALVLRQVDTTKDRTATRAIRAAPDGSVSLAPLPGTRTEVEAIAGILYPQKKDGSILLGPEALEATVKALNASQTLQEFSFLHFACHGILPGEVKGLAEPCLALSLYGDPQDDGFLKMGEIFGLALNAEMVTLSACQTGVEDPTGAAQGISGLARAFFYAGTPRLTVSLWSVSDEATSELMSGFYGNLQAGTISHLGALTAARRSLLASPRFAHPYFWAPFILIGEWR